MLQLFWYGHASFMVKVGGQTIYIDPYVGNASEEADVILITHSHFDHSDEDKIIKARVERTKVFTSLENAGNIPGAEGWKPGQEIKAEDYRIQAVAAYNVNKFREPYQPFHPPGFGLGWVIRSGDHSLYHAGDTDMIPEMAEVKPVEVALLPVGGTYTMTWEEAVEAVKMIQPAYVVPMHFNTPGLNIEADPWDFKEAVESQTQTKVCNIYPGQSLEF